MLTSKQEEWNRRYNVDEYVYGEAPNAYFAHFIDSCPQPGRILLPAEGEGRNAVYAAKKGWQVHAFDFSLTAMDKALALASRSNVTINYEIEGYETIILPDDFYDAVALIYNHMVPDELNYMAQKYHRCLKKGGIILLEAFAKEQIKNTTGGPKIVDMLYSMDDLAFAFRDFNIKSLERLTIELNEGTLHKGEAEIIRMMAEV